MAVVVERREGGRSLRHLVGCPVAPREAPEDNTAAIKSSTSRCPVCWTPEADAPPEGKVAVFAIFAPAGTQEVYVGVSKDPESARYQLIKKHSEERACPTSSRPLCAPATFR